MEKPTTAAPWKRPTETPTSAHPTPRPSVGRTVMRGEEIEQARVVRWSHLAAVRALMPALAWLHHSPNGGKRDAFTGAQMKALGAKPGFPDLILPAWSHDHTTPGLAIEMKSAIGRASEAQQLWGEHLVGQGWTHAVARSAEEARALLCRHLGMDPAAVPPLT